MSNQDTPTHPMSLTTKSQGGRVGYARTRERRRSLDALQMEYHKIDQTSALVRENKEVLHELESLRSEVRSLTAANASLLRRNTDLRRRLDAILKQNGDLKIVQLRRDESLLQIASSLAAVHKSLHRELTRPASPPHSVTPARTPARGLRSSAAGRPVQVRPVSMPPSPASSFDSAESGTSTPRDTSSTALPSFGAAIALMEDSQTHFHATQQISSTTPLVSPPERKGSRKRLSLSIPRSSLSSDSTQLASPAVLRPLTLQRTGSIGRNSNVAQNDVNSGSKGNHGRAASTSFLDELLNFPTASELATARHKQSPTFHPRPRSSSQTSHPNSQQFAISAALRNARPQLHADSPMRAPVSHELVPLFRFKPSLPTTKESPSSIYPVSVTESPSSTCSTPVATPKI